MAIKERPDDCLSCTCIDVGAVLDNAENSMELVKEYSSVAEAQAASEVYAAKAIKASPEVIIKKDIRGTNPVVLKMLITFTCQAELVIFQLSAR